MLGLSQLFGKETIVGLDIGCRMIKIALAEAAGTQWRILKAASCPTPADAIRDGIVVDGPAVSQAIRDLMRLNNIEANGAIAAISGASVIVRHVKMPRMSETLLRKGVRYEASKYISSANEDSMIEFEITGDIPGEDDKMGVMLVAVPKEMVESRLNALSGAGLEPVAIDIETFAMQRSLIDLDETAAVGACTLALLDIGATSTDVCIVTEGKFALTRSIAIAGDNFTGAIKSISRATEWSDLEALKYRVDMGAMMAPDADPEALALAQAMQPAIDELLREVRRSINYYQSQLSDPTNSNLPLGISAEAEESSVAKIIISGGGAKMQGLAQYMTARLGVPTEVWSPFRNPSIHSEALTADVLEHDGPMFSTCIGLALKELSESASKPAARATSKPTVKAKAA
ncbi:pilus assembly protein PilM [Capsulimonas corticalis]|uniref:Pilus assembly protein PilM n=1 Tax=Capsulimonas corticalis TaxID=2219043 RepID=A0A402CPI5_9BACT|nr:type IV pilus assembly protein PilM [Capsulimonas corticalis]BDI32998.1 pilus assembly protein PilM [Capsulimonas corticalis]